MREIKFRVFDLETKRMHVCGEDTHDDIIFIDNTAHYYNLQNGCGSYGEDKVYELMQYTGLKDKNGKEIYEGDIVKRPALSDCKHEAGFICDLIGEVKYENGQYVLETKSKLYVLAALKSIGHFEEAEVIGNLYENPELLA